MCIHDRSPRFTARCIESVTITVVNCVALNGNALRPYKGFGTITAVREGLVARIAASGGTHQADVALRAGGASSRPLCDACEVDWTADGRALIVRIGDHHPNPAQHTYVTALEHGEMLPPLSQHGIKSKDDLGGAGMIHEFDGFVYPSGHIGAYASIRHQTVRNIYRVPLP